MSVIGIIDSSVTECLDSFKESLLTDLSDEISNEEVNNGFDSLKSRFISKMEPINSKLEVTNILFFLFLFSIIQFVCFFNVEISPGCNF